MAQPTPVVAPAPPAAGRRSGRARGREPRPPHARLGLNNTPHPTAVALGRPDNPIAPSNRPATAAIDLGQRGQPGMPASNSGSGPRRHPGHSRLRKPGQPGDQRLQRRPRRPGHSPRRTGGTGPNNATGRTPGQVNLGQNMQATPTHATLPTTSAQSAPKVLFKPTPVYTAEATALHLSGEVAIRIRVSASGSVTVLGITSPLGHGLDQSAERAVQGTRFSPALDASGHPVDWEGVVRVNFQLAG